MGGKRIGKRRRRRRRRKVFLRRKQKTPFDPFECAGGIGVHNHA
jgi:hypothetical protein